ncbi:MAG: 4Fe-4S dicluster domain-containing protein [Phycisphaeraceae bacterium]
MPDKNHNIHEVWFLTLEGLDRLVRLLQERGYTVIAPTVRDGVIALSAVTRADQIASGVRDELAPGRYRLADSPMSRHFQYVVGQDSPKRFFFPPELELVSLHVEGKRFVLDRTAPNPPKLAILGVRPCDLAAIRIQDRVLGYGDHSTARRCETDTYYHQARKQSVLIAANCTQPGGTCFCASMGTGPDAREGYDLSMTEMGGGFIMRAGSDKGRELIDHLPVREAEPAEIELGQLKLEQAGERMGRSLDTESVRQLLRTHIEHPAWDEVAQRCLACANCTMVCPTCFCTTVSDTNDLATGSFNRTRRWESCFTQQFSYTTAGSVRGSIRARYRHWMRHKLCTWYDQFGCPGCVGCGRCITWCPVGIDITEQAQRLNSKEQKAYQLPSSRRGRRVVP